MRNRAKFWVKVRKNNVMAIKLMAVTKVANLLALSYKKRICKIESKKK